MNKGEIGFCARKEGFLEAGALKERRDPAQDSQCQKTLTFRAETSRAHSRISSLPSCYPPRMAVPGPLARPPAGALSQWAGKPFLGSHTNSSC